MTRLRACSLLVLVALTLACDRRIVIQNPIAPSPPSTPAPPVVYDHIEFRVVGEHPTALVQVSNALDGLTQTNAVLPFSQGISVTGRDSMFLSLSARGSSTGFLHVAIFVNGVIFREASSASIFVNPFVQVSGTWRRNR